MHAALLGFGTVGSAFYQLASVSPNLTVDKVLCRRKRPELGEKAVTDPDAVLRDPAIDTVIELIGGDEPAWSFVRAALCAGKNVVTANKLLVVRHYRELLALAKEHRVRLRCAAAAGGAIPWLPSLARVGRADRITAVEGILNGTTQFILSEMTNRGASYPEALAEAQRLGYAEADPTADVEGWDTRRKIVLSADLAFGVDLREEDVPCAGIQAITADDIVRMREKGLIFRLIGRAERRESRITAFVVPTLFPASAPEAGVNGPGNLLSLYAAHSGKLSFSGPGAGGFPTAANVLADCLSLSEGSSYYTDRVDPCRNDLTACSRWLLRSGGEEFFTERIPAKEAFSLYRERKQKDPGVLLARLQEE